MATEKYDITNDFLKMNEHWFSFIRVWGAVRHITLSGPRNRKTLFAVFYPRAYSHYEGRHEGMKGGKKKEMADGQTTERTIASLLAHAYLFARLPDWLTEGLTD